MTKTLADLKILALDCQATGANPQKGHLLELGWMPACAAMPDRSPAVGLQAYLNRLPPSEKIPRAVSRLTGIPDEAMKTAETSAMIWHYLMEAVEKINAENQMAPCPAVIHFARFEKPFLEDLQKRYDPESPFPFQMICTHEIAVRMLPNLPRRGLRAIAGYFGHSMPEFKRSVDHVMATVFIWKQMIQRLNAERGIDTLDQLGDWLASVAPAGRSRRIYPMDPQKPRQLPDKPGIYRMLRANGDLLYIGKATSLKKRVNSYFREKAPHAEHILEMLTQAQKLDFTRTGSAVEAAMLESDEIKRLSPAYNIALRRGQRKLAFCTKDLSNDSTAAHREGTIGPLPQGKSMEAVSTFGHWITRGCRWTDQELAHRGHKLLGLFPEHAPDPACLKGGLALFEQAHVNPGSNQSPLRLLTGLGARLWRLRMVAAETAETIGEAPSETDDHDAPSDASSEERVWTPEAVATSIGHMVMHSAHLIRRARWFCLLSESSLAWDAAGPRDQMKHLMVMEGGSVIKWDVMQADQKIPVAPRFDRSFHRRQTYFSLMRYDRLRVLTTELRRLISENRHIELCLGPSVTMGNDQLKKALRWV